MGDALESLLKISNAIATGALTFLVASLALNIYLFKENRRLQDGRVQDLKGMLERDDRNNAANAAAMEVVRALGDKIGRRS